MREIKLDNGVTLAKIYKNELYNKKHVNWGCEFNDGSWYENPYLASMIFLILEVPETLLKDVTYQKNIKIPVVDMVWVFSGGDSFWKNRKWSDEKALKMWTPYFEEAFDGCKSLHDIMIAMKWLMKTNFIDNIGRFVKECEEE